MSKSMLIINTPKSCEECSLCVAVQGRHYCPGKGTYIQNGERDCSCPLVAVPKKETNADRIRNMTDEQLAEFFAKIREPDEDTIVIDGKEFFAEDEIKEWLQQECGGSSGQ